MITSPRAARVAATRRLHRRSGRAKAGAFLAEGPPTVREALLDVRRPVREVFVTPAAATRHRPLVRLAEQGAVSVTVVTEEVLAALAETVTPQGVVAVVDDCTVGLTALMAAAPGCLAVLCDVRDPGNAGTVVRTADAAGVGGVVFAGESVDPLGGKCVRASAGSLFHLPVVSGVTVDETVHAARQAGLAVYAADAGGPDDLGRLWREGLLAGPVAWLFGNESHGLSADVRRDADRVVRVPILGRAESLNLATAAAVCLYAGALARPETPDRRVE